MRFRLLGPIEFFNGTKWVGVAPAKLRALLAVLLLNRNQVVSNDYLVHQLWERRSPRSANNLVQQYVLRLRRALDDCHAELLTTRAAGYELRVGPEDLDIGRFTELLGAGQAALRAGDADRAASQLTEALALWRGQALADVLPTPVVTAEAARLDEQRMVALEARVDAELARGRAAELISELRTMVREQPLRERRWAQLMLAHYRSGRQGEALAAYREVRRILDTELGVQPGAELERLHRRILRADPTLVLPPAAATIADPPHHGRIDRPTEIRPAQLPADLPAFIGRKQALAELDAILTAAGCRPTSPEIAVLTGTAGIGKTALAVHWAHRIAGRFPDGQLYLNLRGFGPSGQAMHPAEAVRSLLDALAVPSTSIPASLDAQVGLYRSRLAGKRMLIVLDNARDADQVRPLLPGSPGCLVVVTSRKRLTSLTAIEGAHAVLLDLLAAEEARELLVSRIGADRVAAEPDAADMIIASCSRLPLALAIVAARSAAHPAFPLASLASELLDARQRLDALAGEDAATDLRAVLSWSHHSLSGSAARLFRLLGLHPGPDFAVPAAASLIGLPEGQTGTLLAELANANLLREHRPGRYTLHDLLRAYAAELALRHEPDSDRHAANHRLLDHYLHTGYAAVQQINPHRGPISLPAPQPAVAVADFADHESAFGWFATEHAVLVAAVEHAARARFDTHAWQLTWTLTDFLHRTGRWHTWVAVQQEALEAAKRLRLPERQARIHRGIAIALAELGQLDQAQQQLRHALDLSNRLADKVGVAHNNLNLAWTLARQGNHEQAARTAAKALDLFRAAGHRYGEAVALNNVGWYHAQLGHYDRALVDCQRAVELSRSIGDRHTEAIALDSLGFVQHRLQQHDQATARYLRALDLHREAGARHNEAKTLTSLADSYRAAGDTEAARRAYEQAFSILVELGHPTAEQVGAKLKQLGARLKQLG